MRDLARDIASAIELDITDRRGLKWEWDAIDPDVKEKIRVRWVELIERLLPDVSKAPLWRHHEDCRPLSAEGCLCGLLAVYMAARGSR